MSKSVTSRAFTNVRFVVEGKQIPGHKVLCARCDNFKRALEKKESVHVKGIDQETFQSVLLFLYTGSRRFITSAKCLKYVQGLKYEGKHILEAIPPNLEDVLRQEKFCDVTFEVEGEKISGHRIVFAVRSSYFRKLFGQVKVEKGEAIPISGVSVQIFRAIVEYIYCDSLSLQDSQVTGILSAANRFGMSHLKHKCELYLCGKLSEESVFQLFHIAESHQCQVLGAGVLHFLVRHWDDLSLSSQWKHLDLPTRTEIEGLVTHWERVLFV